MVEHWDDYLQFISASTGDALTLSGKIGIPFSFAGISTSNRSDLQQEITDAFANCGVSLSSLDGKWYGAYSDIIYAALEEIDYELRSYDKKRKIGIPEPLVTLLFKYSFPTPIYDMEEYCKTLVNWLGTLPLQ